MWGKLMNERLYYIQKAKDEQLKSYGPEEGVEKKRRGSVVTRQQMIGYRRSTETILVEMIDRIDCSRRSRRRGPRGAGKQMGKRHNTSG